MSDPNYQPVQSCGFCRKIFVFPETCERSTLQELAYGLADYMGHMAEHLGWAPRIQLQAEVLAEMFEQAAEVAA